MTIHDLPAINASLNALSTVFLASGYALVRTKRIAQHRACMLAALTTSARRVSECLGLGPDDAWWGHMPLFWSGGLVIGALAAMAAGARIVLQEIVEPGTALALLEAERCTIMLGWHQAAPLGVPARGVWDLRLDNPPFAPAWPPGSPPPARLALLALQKPALGRPSRPAR